MRFISNLVFLSLEDLLWGQRIVRLHALWENKVWSCELLFDKTALEIKDFGLSGTWPGNEADLQVANLVIILNALTIKSVILVARELPRSILWTSKGITIKEVRNGVGDIVYLNILCRAATLILFEDQSCLSSGISNFGRCSHFISLIINCALHLVNLVQLWAPFWVLHVLRGLSLVLSHLKW